MGCFRNERENCLEFSSGSFAANRSFGQLDELRHGYSVVGIENFAISIIYEIEKQQLVAIEIRIVEQARAWM